MCLRDAAGILISSVITIICKAAPPLRLVQHFHVDLISLDDTCFYTSQHPSAHRPSLSDQQLSNAFAQFRILTHGLLLTKAASLSCITEIHTIQTSA
jgi:hypothetical protein